MTVCQVTKDARLACDYLLGDQMRVWPVTVCQVTTDVSLACDCLPGDTRCESDL